MQLSLAVLERVLAQADIAVNQANPKPEDIRVNNTNWIWATLAGGRAMKLCEAFQRDDWSCGDPAAFFGKLIKYRVGDRIPNLFGNLYKLRKLMRDEHGREFGQRVADHYNIPEEWYRVMLGDDPYIIYTSTREPGSSLARQQLQKLDDIGVSIQLAPDMDVIDIGCGWGGTLAYLRKRFGVTGRGISIAGVQIEHAKRHYAVPGALEFALENYLDTSGRYDRVISIEMIEAVGKKYFRVFFRKVAEILRSGGLFELQAISCPDPRHATDEWIERYIFRGGELGTKEQMIRAAADEGLRLVREPRDFPKAYAWTLRQWRENIIRNWDVLVEQFGEFMLRTFVCYLAMCEAAFTEGRTNVSEFLFVRV